MYKILPIILVVVLSGCSFSPKERISIDPMTGVKVTSLRVDCLDISFFCTGFKIINDAEAYLIIGYLGDDWLFVDSVEMKNNKTGEQIKLKAEFSREVLKPNETGSYGIFNNSSDVGVSELATIKIDEKIYNFLKSSLGNKVTLLVNGSQKRIYRYSDIPLDPKSDDAWWAYFISIYDINPYKVLSISGDRIIIQYNPYRVNADKLINAGNKICSKYKKKVSNITTRYVKENRRGELTFICSDKFQLKEKDYEILQRHIDVEKGLI